MRQGNEGGGKGPLVQEEVSGTLATGNDQILCMATQQGGAEIAENMSPTITSAAGMSGNNQPVLCMASGQANAEVGEDMACSQSARQHKDPQIVTDGYVVRRLTPVECERLQGFPDGWTDLGGTPDAPRYKALGNSMAVPVIRWLGEGIERADALS